MKAKTRLATGLLLSSCALTVRGQDPVAAYPKNYSIALENSVVRVIRVHYGPHETLGVHDHSKTPTIYVYLSNSGPVRFQHFEEPSFTLTRPSTSYGAFRVSPGRMERHTVENTGDTSSNFLRIELKQIPLGRLRQSFRGAAPPNLLESHVSIEFKSQVVEVDRVTCGVAVACSVAPSAAPSVIVAFTRLTPELAAGGVRWLAASEGLALAQDATSSAHLLRILIPSTGK